MKFSIIIVTYRQKPYLRRILESIEIQPYKDIEVIIADDSGDVSMMDLLFPKGRGKRWSFPIKYIWHNEKTFDVKSWMNAKCRNMAAKIADGDYLLIVDGDTIFGEDTIRAYLPFLNEDTLLWGLRYIVNPALMDFQIKSQSQIDSFVVEKDHRGEEAQTKFSGANFVVPRKKFLEVLWNEKIKYYGFDDYEFFERWLYGFGLPAGHIPRSVAYHIEHPAKEGDPRALAIWQETRLRLGLISLN